jgi:hypothetical protein
MEDGGNRDKLGEDEREKSRLKPSAEACLGSSPSISHDSHNSNNR